MPEDDEVVGVADDPPVRQALGATPGASAATTPLLRRRRHRHPPIQPRLSRAVNNLAVQALIAAFADGKAIVDDSSTHAAISEVMTG
ncbi:hypothetical protein ACPPVO_54185 [Dactylosporangium sp. McL0621]|uniref:hypothetical protein n=1 Tax=Dactylosporangium sp. McL0621 TaxID=3415678 RepID=UPI003CEB4847